jgi:hypothetical protein
VRAQRRQLRAPDVELDRLQRLDSAVAERGGGVVEAEAERPQRRRVYAVAGEEGLHQLIDGADRERLGGERIAEADRVRPDDRVVGLAVGVVERRGLRLEAAARPLLAVLVPAGQPPLAAFACEASLSSGHLVLLLPGR